MTQFQGMLWEILMGSETENSNVVVGWGVWDGRDQAAQCSPNSHEIAERKWRISKAQDLCDYIGTFEAW